MKKLKLILPLALPLIILCALAFGIWHYSGYENAPGEAIENLALSDSGRLNRDANSIDFKGLTFTPWDVKTASAHVSKRGRKPYTVMVYMNGSDLESENGAATDDIIEMLESGVNEDFVNIILFTGGTNRWRNDVIPENDCKIWEISKGLIHEITGVGLVNMGDPGTLASFINFSLRNFPAEKYGLIMWDHGGGSIAGYGHDEKFNESSLSLLEMNYAFEQSGLAENKLEFLGFDSCLMATIEMSIVASDYANYLVASEDVEPSGGWDYSFLSALNKNPKASEAELGTEIVDYFMDYYGDDSHEILTLSVIDLSNTAKIMDAMGSLMAKCSDNLLLEKVSSFRNLAKKRSRTKTFGEGSPRDNQCDMVDIGDMADKLSDLFPDEAKNISEELEKSVKYNRHNSDINLSGLSAYYVYGGKEIGRAALNTYASLKMNRDYTRYLNSFYSMLLGGGNVTTRSRSSAGQENNVLQDDLISTELTLWQPVGGESGKFIMLGIQDDENRKADALWPSIDGKNVCLYRISDSDNRMLYAIPSELNGRKCDIIVLISEKFPNGKILGARQEDGLIIQKGYDKIEDGDKISFYYQQCDFENNNTYESLSWRKSDELVVNGELKLEWSVPKKGESYYSLLVTDIRNNKYFTDLEAVK